MMRFDLLIIGLAAIFTACKKNEAVNTSLQVSTETDSAYYSQVFINGEEIEAVKIAAGAGSGNFSVDYFTLDGVKKGSILKPVKLSGSLWRPDFGLIGYSQVTAKSGNDFIFCDYNSVQGNMVFSLTINKNGDLLKKTTLGRIGGPLDTLFTPSSHWITLNDNLYASIRGTFVSNGFYSHLFPVITLFDKNYMPVRGLKYWQMDTVQAVGFQTGEADDKGNLIVITPYTELFNQPPGGNNAKGLVLIKFDQKLKEISKKHYSKSNGMGLSILPVYTTKDHVGNLVSIIWSGNDFNNYDHCFINKYSTDMQLLASKKIDLGNEPYRLKRIIQTDDGGFLAVGFQYDASNQRITSLIVKMDAEFNVVQKKHYTQFYSSFLTDIVKNPAGGYIGCGGYDGLNGNLNGLLMLIDNNGNLKK